jgi:uncharacterized spore protein YtfJ
MNVQEVITQARDVFTVKRVFGDPLEEQGMTIIPAATIRGGAGGGEGMAPDRKGQGGGSGFGMVAKPAGAYVVRDGNATWRPAIDVNRVILGGQAVAIAALLTARAIVKARTEAAPKRRAPRRPFPLVAAFRR